MKTITEISRHTQGASEFDNNLILMALNDVKTNT